MYPRSRGKGTPLGGSGTDQEGPSFNESSPAANTTANALDGSNASSSASPPSQLQQQQQQQPVRPRRSPQTPFAMSGSVTINLSSGRNDAAYYANPSSHQMPPPPPPPPPPAMPTAPYYDGGNLSCGGGGGGPGPYYGGGNNNAGMSHGYMQRGAAPAYEQSLPPPPPPPPPMPSAYDGEGMGYHDAIASTPTSPPSFSAGANPANSYSSFSHHHHSRTGSTNNNAAMGAMMGGGGADRGNMNGGLKGNGDYRPPPVYGDLPLGGPVSNPHNAGNSSSNSGNSSFSRAGPSNSGHNANPNSARLPPYAAASAGVGGGAAGAGPVPSSPFAGRHYDGGASGPTSTTSNQQQGVTSPASTAGAANAAARLQRGPLGLKITVGANATVVPNPAVVSPLLNSPLQTGVDGSAPAADGDATAAKNAPGTTKENATPPMNPSDRSCSNNAGESSPKVTPAAGAAAAAAADAEGEPSTSALKPTVEQAEARYQYLYEEFRKMSRVRAKLVEDTERLKRELAASAEEAQYYRQKTLTAAEEREAIVHDYNADIHYLLRLVDALASDVLAAHKKAAKRTEGHESKFTATNTAATAAATAKADIVPSTPQLAIDVAASRLASMGAAHSAFPSVPATPDGSATMPPETPGLAEHLGLRHGMWMTRLSTATSEVVTCEDGYVSAPEMSERSHSASAAALTPLQKQGVLLRDEMRDVHRSTHAAMNSYMTSLDYGSIPVSSMRSGGGSSSAGPSAMRRSCPDRFSQRQFKSEYRGLHLHVDVPRFHAQNVTDMPTGVDQPLGQANDGANSMNSSLTLSYAPRERPRGASGAL